MSRQAIQSTPLPDGASEGSTDKAALLLTPPAPPRPATLSPDGTAGPTGTQVSFSKRVTKISLLPGTNSGGALVEG